ncbi:hypothetical protein H9L12_09315 [Sphingomonas rhizophila]|uniref:Uncharacterized protein n=1 Tax=Sphingomonas rhizophila TaxID=2071607 RepID=A0A7G9S9I3_9SPHN|nr:hypothetical protein [Sphingomonas rhizophila]QNN64508.1 hypothetical protein H9L12_09315 [Sphingomonas rhizophila]
MRKHQIESAAFDIATQVRAVEDMIDAALVEMAELQGRMVRARAVMGVGPATGQAAFAKLADTLQALIVARGGMADCHGELAAAKQSVPGLRTTSYGDTDDCPPPKGIADLRVVA